MKKAFKQFPKFTKATRHIMLLLLLVLILFSKLTQTKEGLVINPILRSTTNELRNDIPLMTIEGIELPPSIIDNWLIICFLFVAFLSVLIYASKILNYFLFERYYRITKRTVTTNSKPKVTYKLQTAIALKVRGSVDESKLIWWRFNKYGRSFKHKSRAKEYFDELTALPKIVDTEITEIKKRKRKITFLKKAPIQYEFKVPFFPKIFLGTKIIWIPTWIIMVPFLAILVHLLLTIDSVPMPEYSSYVEKVKIFAIASGGVFVLTFVCIGAYMRRYAYYLRVVKRNIKQGTYDQTSYVLQVSRVKKNNTKLNNLKWTDLVIRVYRVKRETFGIQVAFSFKKSTVENKKELIEIFEKQTTLINEIIEETIS